MEFEEGGIYRNKHMIDVDMEVIAVVGGSDQGAILHVYWLHRNCPGHTLCSSERIAIQGKHIPDWKKIDQRH